MHRTPKATGGIIFLSRTVGSASMPSMPGIEKPYTSASRIATSWPALTSETARLTVTEDLPTPPLPDVIPMTRVGLVGP